MPNIPQRKSTIPPTRSTKAVPQSPPDLLHAAAPLACRLNGQDISSVELRAEVGAVDEYGSQHLSSLTFKHGAREVLTLTFAVDSAPELLALKEQLYTAFVEWGDSVMYNAVAAADKLEQARVSVVVRLASGVQEQVDVDADSADIAAVKAMVALGWPRLLSSRNMKVFLPGVDKPQYPLSDYAVVFAAQDGVVRFAPSGAFPAPSAKDAAQMAVAKYGREAATKGGWHVYAQNPYTGSEEHFELHRFASIANDTQLRAEMSRQQVAPTRQTRGVAVAGDNIPPDFTPMPKRTSWLERMVGRVIYRQPQQEVQLCSSDNSMGVMSISRMNIPQPHTPRKAGDYAQGW